MLAPLRACVAMSPPPMPPAPMPARFTRSLGAMKPAPPSTWRGTIVKPNARLVPAATKSRRETVRPVVFEES